MNIIEKICELFKDQVVLSILESKESYIVSVCNDMNTVETATECIYAVNKKTFETTEFSYFNRPDEYMEACNNVVYRRGDSNKSRKVYVVKK